MPTGIAFRLHRRNRMLHDFGQIHALASDLDKTTSDSRHIEKVIDQTRLEFQLPLGGLSRTSHGPGVGGLASPDLEAVTDRRERIAQFMREHRKKIVLLTIGD